MKNNKPDYIGTDYSFDTLLSSSAIDELPLWSAPFGLSLLNAVKYRKNITALDIGFGTGFPLLELAQRLGKTSTIYGIDPWRPSHLRTKYKMKFHGIDNILLIKGGAEKIPLKDKSVDLIVSNNGTNNVQDIEKVFSECSRVAKKGAQFLITVNLDGTFREFYTVLINLLRVKGKGKEAELFEKHIYDKRKPPEEIKNYFESNGFIIKTVKKQKFEMVFTDFDVFLNHSLIRIGFFPSWNKILPYKSNKTLYKEAGKQIEGNRKSFLKMSVPYILIDSRRA